MFLQVSTLTLYFQCSYENYNNPNNSVLHIRKKYIFYMLLICIFLMYFSDASSKYSRLFITRKSNKLIELQKKKNRYTKKLNQ